jgi:hypothetical protein
VNQAIAAPFLYGSSGTRGNIVHRLAQEGAGRSVCGAAIPTYRRHRVVELDPHEVWCIGWMPCAKCFPKFPRAKVAEMYAAEEHDRYEEDRPAPGYDANWETVRACRVRRGFLSKPNINGGEPSIRPDPCPTCWELDAITDGSKP